MIEKGRIQEQGGSGWEVAKYAQNQINFTKPALENLPVPPPGKRLYFYDVKGNGLHIAVTGNGKKTLDRVLQADEFERFFLTLNGEEEDFRDFVMLTLFTGARKSNVLSMSWQHINLKSGSWTIPAEQSKNSQSQSIVLTEVELEILSRRQKAQGADAKFVFPSTGKTGHVTDVKKSWASFLGRANIEDLHIHDLRRSLASWMASTGANVSVIRSALNHKDVKTTLTVYARANKESELAARKLAHKTMLELGKPSEPKN
ncbi:MAG: site-specific integrase [Candidatus Obscuribacterales bacterium]|nr:site-specific integrase [Candidatus Obscuribacterales bacterium]